VDGMGSYPGRRKIFLSYKKVYTGPGAHPAFYSVGTGFPGGKAAGT
jgi:hypothetical protein